MAVLKCKMCGGTLEVTKNEKIVTCEFCGTTQTIPTIDSEKKTLLYNRANAFRLKNEFDKAMVTYENIVEEFTEDSEAYWGLVLCKYGIEYVDDPKTEKKVPTCHRTLTKSILNDDDYLNAIKYSDVIARALYEKEAKEIDRLQKEILVLSQKEEPYDIFICYKETDNNGKRTIDSVIAQDIYDELTKKGYKVFFARITLESKLGSEYEPIIYAALTSSKAMLVIGTKPEYFNAVWVRNEWSRFIDMMHSDTHKYLIPCYKDMDAYDLPEEMLSYQCQDLNKLGYMQDLVRGLDKIFGKDKVVIEQVPKRTLNAFGRIEMLLEQGDRNKAKEIIENLLNEDYTNSKAYLYSLMIELNLKKEIDLEKLDIPLTTYQNYQNAMKFASNDYKKVLESYNNKILENIENIKKEEIYKEAYKNKLNQNYDYAIKLYSKIKDYKDSNKQIEICNEEIVNKKEKLYNESIKEAEKENYDKALSLLNRLQNYKDTKELYNKYVELKEKENIYRKAEYCARKKTIDSYTQVINLLSKVKDYKDSELLIEKYKEAIQKIKDKTIKIFKISTLVSVILISLIILITSLIIPTINLNKARNLIDEGSLTESEKILTNLDGFGDSENLLQIIKAHKEFSNNNYEEGIEYLETIGTTIQIDYNPNEGELLEVDGKTVACKDGYTFYGWLIDSYDINNKKNNYYANVCLKASWEVITYDITYELNNGTMNININTYDCTQEVHIPNATKEGYTFIGWNDGKATKKDYVINKNTYGNINLEAIFEPNKYTIYLDYNGGIGDKESIEIKYDEFYNLPVPVSTKDGYKFIGWYDNNILVEDDIYKITNDLYLQARYEYIYYVTYNLDGGECNNLPTEFTESTKFNLPTPTKQGYLFLGWYDENDELVSELNNKDYTLKAKYVPFIKENNYIYFGRYPQTKVTDSYIINALNQIITINEYGYIEYDENEYKEYYDNYYLVEPIKWKILETNNNSYKLVSDLILDQQDFYSSTYDRTINGNTIYPNNYEYSDIREWLNNDFINASFNTEEQNIIKKSLVDNSASTTSTNPNKYACNNTNDKVYLLSYKDFTKNYFTNISDRQAKVTDYAKDKGVYESNDYGYFWLRPPYSNDCDSYHVNYVNYDGYRDHSYCSSSNIGARPALEIKIK